MNVQIAEHLVWLWLCVNPDFAHSLGFSLLRGALLLPQNIPIQPSPSPAFRMTIRLYNRPHYFEMAKWAYVMTLKSKNMEMKKSPNKNQFQLKPKKKKKSPKAKKPTKTGLTVNRYDQ